MNTQRALSVAVYTLSLTGALIIIFTAMPMLLLCVPSFFMLACAIMDAYLTQYVAGKYDDEKCSAAVEMRPSHIVEQDASCCRDVEYILSDRDNNFSGIYVYGGAPSGLCNDDGSDDVYGHNQSGNRPEFAYNFWSSLSFNFWSSLSLVGNGSRNNAPSPDVACDFTF